MKYTFTVATEGYDKKQVKEVVSRLDTSNRELEDQNEYLKSKITELSDKFESFVEKYKDLQDRYERQQNTSEELARLALREANALVTEAKSNADLIVDDALKKVNIITTDAMRLKTEVSSFKENVKVLAHNVVEYIDKSAVLVESATSQNKVEPRNPENIRKLKQLIED